ncbi:MAG TPA: dipeptidase [Rhodothermales bacterium]|nr:dipeptidase [Rhodothermales bacterium]
MDKALQYAGNRFDSFVGELEDWLRIPSISTESQHAGDVRKAAEWLADDLRRVGVLRVEVMPTKGHPIVYAEHAVDSSKPTVLVYGHYDVQPPDPLDLWHSPPFEPVVKDHTLFARGSSDDKGQVFMHVKAAEAYLQGGEDLPVNLKFIVEGEEENGSDNLAPFIEEHRDLLKADVVLISDTSMFAPGVPSITYGLRGLAYVEVILTGPNRDLHSGVYGGAVENPINVLCKLIAGLHDAQHGVAIPGFYDDVRPLTDEERSNYRALPFDKEEWKASIGVEAVRTEEGYGILEATSARPALDVNGIWGGYQGEGAKTVLPAKAGAKISMRLVPDQRPGEVVEKLRRYFESRIPDTVTLEFRDLHGGHPSITPLDSPAMQAAKRAMQEVYGREPLFTREGGSIPVVADFKRILGIDTVLFGFGLDSDAIHSPNEHFGLDRFKQGIESIIRFFGVYAREAA